jgi:FlaA1/EpsC-like NDP-sugar epimerase
VVPIFLQQRREGRITITDPKMTRFWITLEQGVRFVIRCLELMKGGEIFVPKIPSMRLTELAEALAPGCKQEIIGVRPGEKLHEVLISADESRHAVEYDGMYVIAPGNPWSIHCELGEGKALPPGFVYASDTNTRWLTQDQFKSLIGGAV